MSVGYSRYTEAQRAAEVAARENREAISAYLVVVAELKDFRHSRNATIQDYAAKGIPDPRELSIAELGSLSTEEVRGATLKLRRELRAGSKKLEESMAAYSRQASAALIDQLITFEYQPSTQSHQTAAVQVHQAQTGAIRAAQHAAEVAAAQQHWLEVRERVTRYVNELPTQHRSAQDITNLVRAVGESPSAVMASVAADQLWHKVQRIRLAEAEHAAQVAQLRSQFLKLVARIEMFPDDPPFPERGLYEELKQQPERRTAETLGRLEEAVVLKERELEEQRSQEQIRRVTAIITETLEELGYQIAGSPTTWLPGGGKLLKQPQWESHAVEVQVGRGAFDIEIVRTVAGSDSQNDKLRDTEIEQVFCASLPEIHQALEARGLQLESKIRPAGVASVKKVHAIQPTVSRTGQAQQQARKKKR